MLLNNYTPPVIGYMYNAGTCTTQLHVTDYTEFNWCLGCPGASTMTSPSLPPDSELLPWPIHEPPQRVTKTPMTLAWVNRGK